MTPPGTRPFHPLLYRIHEAWRRYWILRWTLANIVGWSAALLVAVLLLQWLGLWGTITGGAIAGALAGIAQSYALDITPPPSRRSWILWSALGGALATIPVYLLALVALLHLTIGLLMMGAMFGGIVGALQYRLLTPAYDDAAGWWIVANIIAGGLCAPLTLTRTILPVAGTLGPVTFGLITGFALSRLHQQAMTLPDE